MKTLISSALLVLSFSFSSMAHADGFLCATQSGLSIKVFNHVQPLAGTRVPAVMIVSDTNARLGERTVARFEQADAELLMDQDGSYLAKVDLRDSSKSEGLDFQGTRLENIDAIKLYVDFSYDKPVADGAELTGTVTLLHRNAGLKVEQAACRRYLKN